MNTNIDHKGLAHLAGELNALSAKKNPTAADTARRSALQSTISVLKMGGITLDEINQRAANEVAIEMGKKPERFNTLRLPARDIAHAKAWRSIIRNDGHVNYEEFRDEGIGHVTQSYYNGNNGSLIPTEFLDQVFAEMKWFDPLVDPNVVTYVETSHGRPLQVPMMDDTANDASVSAENSDQSGNETDIAHPNAALLGAYSYRSPMWRASFEALQDLEGNVALMNLFKSFAANRIGRGAGRDLMTGNGSGKPLGLVSQLIMTGVNPVLTQGNARNINGGNTGSPNAYQATSIGSQDLAALYFSVDRAYRGSPKCAWLMNDNTLKSLWQLVSEQGLPLVNIVDGKEFIYGKPVYIAPSMDSIGSSSNPIIFGDLIYWITRCSMDQTYVKLFFEAPGLVEKAEVGLRMYARYDGTLMFSSTQTPPINYLQMHS